MAAVVIVNLLQTSCEPNTTVSPLFWESDPYRQSLTQLLPGDRGRLTKLQRG